MIHQILHTDKYQLTMMYAHWKQGTKDRVRVFDAYFRELPFGNGFAVFAGLQRIVDYLNHLQFTDEDIAYLREQPEGFDEVFLEELKRFKFTGNLHAVPEGTLVFPNEPILRVEAPIFQAHLIETAILNFMNYQTLIATKAARIRRVAPNDVLFEFGTRRAQEADAAIWGSRAAYIAGFNGTSNMLAGKWFGIPTIGTHAHAWVQDSESELEAFRSFSEVFPDHSVLLVDTYDTLKSGVPNAIQVAKELEQRGHRLIGIRLDSGDLAYLSIEARKMLDEAGLSYVQIIASNDLDEHLISDLKAQGAKIDGWGIGTQLITAADQPALGGVYKLVAKKEQNGYVPTIKISSNPEKITTPGYKTVYRIVNKESEKAEGDYVSFVGEDVESQKQLKLFDPIHTFKQKVVSNFRAVELLTPIFIEGKQVYDMLDLPSIQDYHQQQLSLFWESHLRKLNPQRYYVNLSEQVWNVRMELISQHKKV